MPWYQILLLALQVAGALAPEIAALIQTIQNQGGSPTPAQAAKLVAYAAAHHSIAEGIQTLVNYHTAGS